jgi:hypothetical protein
MVLSLRINVIRLNLITSLYSYRFAPTYRQTVSLGRVINFRSWHCNAIVPSGSATRGDTALYNCGLSCGYSQVNRVGLERYDIGRIDEVGTFNLTDQRR